MAQYNLGTAYLYGLGVAKDYRDALEWFGKAAARGDARAQNNLGVMYLNGWEVSGTRPWPRLGFLRRPIKATLMLK